MEPAALGPASLSPNETSVLDELSKLPEKDLNDTKIQEIFKKSNLHLPGSEIPKFLTSCVKKLGTQFDDSPNIYVSKMLIGATKALSYLERRAKQSEKKELITLHKQLDQSLKTIQASIENFINIDFSDTQTEIHVNLMRLLGPHGINLEGESSLYFFMQSMPLNKRSEFASNLKQLVSKCIETRDRNLELLSRNDGSIGYTNPECNELYTRLFVEVGMANAPPSKVIGKEKIDELLQTILQHALLDDVQVHTDSFVFILPPSIRPEAPNDRIHARTEELADEYTKLKSEIEKSSLPASEKRKKLEELKFQRNYRQPDRISGLEMEKWESHVGTADCPFEQGTRVIGYMTPDKAVKNENCEVLLDLRPLKITHPSQCTQAFEIINTCTQEAKVRPDLFKNWMAIKNNTPPPTTEQILALFTQGDVSDSARDFIDAFNKLSHTPIEGRMNPEQIRVLLGIALDFSYQIIHDMRLSYIELSQMP